MGLISSGVFLCPVSGFSQFLPLCLCYCLKTVSHSETAGFRVSLESSWGWTGMLLSETVDNSGLKTAEERSEECNRTKAQRCKS